MDREYAAERRQMVERQIRARGVSDPRVLAAMAKVPRHLFVPEKMRHVAYEDGPVSIGRGQTISQPYMVALMTECLEPGPEDQILEIGTGSGYQTAVLAEMVRQVDSIERIAELAERARGTLAALGYVNVVVVEGDGSLGLPERAPFDGIVVTAGSPEIPATLVRELKIGGRLVIPVGDAYHQTLYKVWREAGDRVKKKAVTGCVFVPLIGAHGWSDNHSKTFL
jgi:protein-L-isoaspartate(D-aspartate) O-methyltransferase